MGRALALGVYRYSRNFPSHELYGLISQIRRAAVSVPANIAEGAGRPGTGEFLQFLSIAAGSLAELETLLRLSRELDYLPLSAHGELAEQARRLDMALNAMIASLKRRRKETGRNGRKGKVMDGNGGAE